MTDIDIQYLRQWIGKTTRWDGRITAEPFARMAATLGRLDLLNGKAPALPPLWHWLYGQPILEQSQLRADGMPLESDILPPISLPRRMWASSALQFHDDLHVGGAIRRASRIANIAHKQGRTGELVFVELEHTLTGPQGVALTERHTIVFRGLGEKRPMKPAKTQQDGDPACRSAEQEPEPDHSREIVPDEILLFRYSALTSNSHRIHYDRPHATQTEGYPGLVVHGPLIATLLLDLVDRHCPRRRIQSFSFKAVHPIFDLHPFRLNLRLHPSSGKQFTTWATDYRNRTCMHAEGIFN
ncbi:MaoC family dehydratase N-terminal domain-containing protein [Pusillimonas sp. SM2304]|uniref:FAS1-like dehydratase domain-containing protein n=1 Tax=Pusillimonas sp. SM2304 TaxID=3073241 RepID=UPI002875DFCC|nr:MaoC family dehydratase N-terminal domain-containing protein [Pusillimonas sp. SM2304]MDS1139442.1 MaoC family dehydratase N-terminal domain-containing protein [Pusillimonas sp. SM2304]